MSNSKGTNGKQPRQPAWIKREDVHTYLSTIYSGEGSPYGKGDQGLARWVAEEGYNHGGYADHPGPVEYFERRKQRWNSYTDPNYAGPDVEDTTQP